MGKDKQVGREETKEGSPGWREGGEKEYGGSGEGCHAES